MLHESDFDGFDDETVDAATTGFSTAIKAKEKGVEFRNVEKATRPVRSITTLQPLPKIDPKDKELAQRLHEKELAELDIVTPPNWVAAE
ncbi:hypothetical protein Tco_0338486 [Tanacetum coccineum]